MNRLSHNRRRFAFASLLVVLLALAPTPAAHAQVDPPQAAAAEISESLQSQLNAADGPVSFLVLMAEQTDASLLLRQQGVSATGRTTRATLIYAQLTTVARRTQAPVRLWLEANHVPYRAYYLVNMIAVEGDASLAATLSRLPGVGRLVGNPAVSQPLAVATPTHSWLNSRLVGPMAQSSAPPYGIEYTHAPAVWALGYRGQGIVVASQDTGVEWDHPALKARYRGVVSDTVAMTYTVDHVYNWFDAKASASRPARCDPDPQTPCDDHGHGTHTVGTILGDATAAGDAILGMAPEAQWIGCRNMDHGVGTRESYIACFQFFLAPYPQGGDPMTDGRPTLGPDVISNSWGCPPQEIGCENAAAADPLRQAVETARAAGQMVVASAGNDGPSCSSTMDPIGIYDAAFSVGAHNSAGTIAAFSSRGPVTVDGSNRRKPDLVAPGVGIHSTTVNHGYTSLSGTSMASPHVVGAVALLWSAAPDLHGQIDLTEQVLIKSATPVTQTQCSDGPNPISPNNTYGYGRLDVLAAVELAQQPVTLTVQVLAADNTPVAGMAITLTDQLTGYTYLGVTSADGAVQLPPLFAGDYQIVTAAADEFESPLVTLSKGEVRQVAVTARGAEPALQWYFPFVVGG